LLVRVWLEEGSGEFRARLTAVGGAESKDPGQERTVALASSPGEVLTAVSHWLDGFLGDATGMD